VEKKKSKMLDRVIRARKSYELCIKLPFFEGRNQSFDQRAADLAHHIRRCDAAFHSVLCLTNAAFDRVLFVRVVFAAQIVDLHGIFVELDDIVLFESHGVVIFLVLVCTDG